MRGKGSDFIFFHKGCVFHLIKTLADCRNNPIVMSLVWGKVKEWTSKLLNERANHVFREWKQVRLFLDSSRGRVQTLSCVPRSRAVLQLAWHVAVWNGALTFLLYADRTSSMEQQNLHWSSFVRSWSGNFENIRSEPVSPNILLGFTWEQYPGWGLVWFGLVWFGLVFHVCCKFCDSK